LYINKGIENKMCSSSANIQEVSPYKGSRVKDKRYRSVHSWTVIIKGYIPSVTKCPNSIQDLYLPV
jgi:hypothetical protein